MENVVVSFTWGTCPNMPCCIANKTKRRNFEKMIINSGKKRHTELQGEVREKAMIRLKTIQRR